MVNGVDELESMGKLGMSFNEAKAGHGGHTHGLDSGLNKIDTNKLSERSHDSSVDEEMLGKIKDIYSEMRKHSGTN